MQNEVQTRVKVFWQPGCSSCLRTKELLTKHGIEFESVNVHGNPVGLAQLTELGARSVPVVSVGTRYTLCQSFDQVIQFLGLNIELTEPLPPADLVHKIDVVLTAAARYTLQIPEEKFRSFFRDRNRTVADTAFHIFRVAEMGLEAGQQIELQFEGFDDLPPKDWSARQIADWGIDVRDRFACWWDGCKDRSMQFTVPTYYGRHTMHNVMERTTWHAAHHTRQLILMLEEYGVTVDTPLKAEDLDGLPLPDKVWG